MDKSSKNIQKSVAMKTLHLSYKSWWFIMKTLHLSYKSWWFIIMTAGDSNQTNNWQIPYGIKVPLSSIYTRMLLNISRSIYIFCPVYLQNYTAHFKDMIGKIEMSAFSKGYSHGVFGKYFIFVFVSVHVIICKGNKSEKKNWNHECCHLIIGLEIGMNLEENYGQSQAGLQILIFHKITMFNL